MECAKFTLNIIVHLFFFLCGKSKMANPWFYAGFELCVTALDHSRKKKWTNFTPIKWHTPTQKTNLTISEKRPRKCLESLFLFFCDFRSHQKSEKEKVSSDKNSFCIEFYLPLRWKPIWAVRVRILVSTGNNFCEEKEKVPV